MSKMTAAPDKTARPSRRRRRPWLIRGGLLLLLIAGAAGAVQYHGGPAVVYEQARTALRAKLVAHGFVVDRVVAVGRRNSAREDLLARLDVDRGMLIFDVDLDAARARIESLGWVKSAVVRRLYPDVIELRLEERDPFALWQQDGALSLIDAEGVVIQKGGVEHFAYLPLVVGKGAPENARVLWQKLAAYPVLAERVVSAVRVGERRWDLHLKNGLQIRLPEGDTADSLARLADLQEGRRIFARDIAVIDMRLPDRLVVRQSEEAKARRESEREGKTI